MKQIYEKTSFFPIQMNYQALVTIAVMIPIAVLLLIALYVTDLQPVPHTPEQTAQQLGD